MTAGRRLPSAGGQRLAEPVLQPLLALGVLDRPSVRSGFARLVGQLLDGALASGFLELHAQPAAHMKPHRGVVAVGKLKDASPTPQADAHGGGLLVGNGRVVHLLSG